MLNNAKTRWRGGGPFGLSTYIRNRLLLYCEHLEHGIRYTCFTRLELTIPMALNMHAELGYAGSSACLLMPLVSTLA